MDLTFSTNRSIVLPVSKKRGKEEKMHTYTVTFSGTMYFEADSADEAYELMADALRETASDFDIEVSE